MGESKRTCELCGRAPGTPHRDVCARSRHAQRRLAVQSESLGAPGWLHVSAVVALDAEIEARGDFTLPPDGPRSGAGVAAFYQLPGETYTRPAVLSPSGEVVRAATPPGAGGRARRKVCRYAWAVTIPPPKQTSAEGLKIDTEAA